MAVSKTNVFSIAMAFIGTIIGAGYASGQELMQFFGDFGTAGISGLACSALFFFLYAALSMTVGQRMQSDNYAEVMSPAKLPVFMFAVDIAIFSFLFGILVIMVAGSSALFMEQFGLPDLVGGGVLLTLTVATTWWGVSSIEKGFNLAVPILLIGTAVIAAIVIVNPHIQGGEAAFTVTHKEGLIGNWFVSSMLYVFYNMLPGLCVIIPLGFLASRPIQIVQSAALGSLGLTVLGFVLVTAILKNYSLVTASQIPMLDLAKRLSPAAGYLYALLMFIAIYSTAVGLIYGKLARLKSVKWYHIKYDRATIVLFSVLSLVLSKVGFVALIATVYPFYGYVSGIILLGLIFNYFYYAPGKNREKAGIAKK